MLGRPKLGTHRMVTVATRVEPDELQRLRQLASECSMSVCGYMRELVRLELSRAGRNADLYGGRVNGNRKPIGSDGGESGRHQNRFSQ
jgi:hypothetical protein